jgi:predicted nucleic acid-binding protein
LPTVSDASPLIWLSKIGRIGLLRKLYGEVMVPEEVYREVVEEGLERGFSDALVVKDGVDEGWIRVSKLNEEKAELCHGMVEHASEIHLGEAQAIALAREEGALLLMDESSGRAFAEAWGLRVRGTLYVLLTALRDGILSKDETRDAMLQLVEKEFRIDPKLLARLLKEVECFIPRRE